MASYVYPKARQRLLEHMLNDTSTASAGFFLVGVSSSYVYNAAHEVIGDLSNIVIPETALAGESILANGILDADNVVFTGLVPPIALDAIVVYAKWTGGSLLFAYIDQTTNASLPQTIENDEAQIIWDADGIFKV